MNHFFPGYHMDPTENPEPVNENTDINSDVHNDEDLSQAEEFIDDSIRMVEQPYEED